MNAFKSLGLKAGNAALICMLSLGAIPAQAILLSTLLDGGELTVGDKLFSEFELEFDGGTKLLNPELIDVTGLAGKPNKPGLLFTAIEDALTVANGEWIDFGFNFKVTVLDPDRHITGASLRLTDFVQGGDGLIQIEDAVFDPDLINLANLFVEGDALFGNDLFDVSDIDPQSMVVQEINVFIDSGFDGVANGINTFEVNKWQVPEPGITALLGLGLAVLGLVRRKIQPA